MGELGKKFLHKLPDMEILRNLESPFILWIQIDIYFLASTSYNEGMDKPWVTWCEHCQRSRAAESVGGGLASA